LIADFTASEDQLLAGVSMKLVGLVVALAAFGVCFFKWAGAADKKKTGQ
jgi:hypothetical protein